MGLQDRLRSGAEQQQLQQQQQDGSYEQSQLPTALAPQQSLRAREGDRRADPYAELKTRDPPRVHPAARAGAVRARGARAISQTASTGPSWSSSRSTRRLWPTRSADSWLARSPTTSSATGRSSRPARRAPSRRSWSTAPNQIYVERAGKIEETDDGLHRRRAPAADHRPDRLAGRPADRRVLADGRRASSRRQPRERDHPAARAARADADDPQVLGRPYTMDDLIEFGTSHAARRALPRRRACAGKLNVLISGGTGAGKTTLLNALSAFIPNDERIITIEDAAELQLQQEHVIPLEARPPNIEGQGEIRIRELVRNALRMRPDRIIVGEVRGAETLDMLQAMNTGHEGSLTTIHANSPRDALVPARDARADRRRRPAAARDPRADLERLRPGHPDHAADRRLAPHQPRHRGAADGVGRRSRCRTSSSRGRRTRRRPGTKGLRLLGPLQCTGLKPHFLNKMATNGVVLPAAFFENEEGDLTARGGFATASFGKGLRR